MIADKRGTYIWKKGNKLCRRMTKEMRGYIHRQQLRVAILGAGCGELTGHSMSDDCQPYGKRTFVSLTTNGNWWISGSMTMFAWGFCCSWLVEFERHWITDTRRIYIPMVCVLGMLLSAVKALCAYCLNARLMLQHDKSLPIGSGTNRGERGTKKQRKTCSGMRAAGEKLRVARNSSRQP